MMNNVIIYGAYGYTGKLIVDLAVRKGYKPTISGRNKVLLEELANKHNLKSVCFKYDDQLAWDAVLKDKSLLINCAGPFSLTIRPILAACLRNKVHYTDITGEIDVFDYVHKHDEDAKTAGIIMMPGTGFDIVPTDCLAKFLKEKLPSATHLELAFESSSGLSRGTALSLLNRFDQGGAYRQKGKIESFDMGSIHKTIHFGGKDRFVVGIGWGDVFTAFQTTQIPNITVYTAMPPKTFKTMKTAWKWRWLIKSTLFQAIGRKIIRNKIVGPSQDKRENLKTFLWGKVSDANGKEVIAEMTTPESYSLTATTAILCAEHILNGKAQAGFNAPAGAFGADFILKVDGVSRR